MTERAKITWTPQLEDGAEEEVQTWLEDFSIQLAVTIVAASFVVSFVWTQIRASLEKKKPFAELPMPPGSHWLFGLAKYVGGSDFVKQQDHLYQKYANEHGQVGFFMMSRPAIGVTHWEDALAVCKSETHRRILPLVQKHASMILGPERVILMNGKKWRRRHAIVRKALTPKAIERYREAEATVTETLINSIEKRVEISEEKAAKFRLIDLMEMITMDIFFKVGWSFDLNSSEKLKHTPFAQAFDHLESEFSRRISDVRNPFNYFYSIPTTSNLEHQRNRLILETLMKKLIERRRKAVAPNSAKQESKEDLLDFFLKAQVEIGNQVDDDSLSEEGLVALLLGNVFGGYDTTSVTLTYAIYVLSKHPSVEQICVAEARKAKSIIDIDDLGYCRAVILETLRLYPPADTTLRSLQKPVTLKGGFVAPQGCNVCIPIWTIHHSSDNFPDPEQFLPERWTHRDSTGKWQERKEADKNTDAPFGNRNALLAFSGGARSCPGQQFAMQEAVIVLAGLLKKLEFSCSSDYQLQPTRRGFVQGPKDGLPVTIKKRA